MTLHGPEVLVVWKTTEREGDHVKNEPSHKLQRTAWTLARLQQCCEWHSRLQTDLLPRIATPERGSEEQNLHACRCHDIVHPEWVNMNRGIQRVSCETEKTRSMRPAPLIPIHKQHPSAEQKTQDARHRDARSTPSTHQAELQGPDPACPELDHLRRLAGLRDVHFDPVPPALALAVKVRFVSNKGHRGSRRTAGFLQNSRSFCAVAIWL